MDPALAAALEDERLRSARHWLTVRAIIAAMLSGVHTVIFVATGHALARDAYPFIVLYAVLSWAGWIWMRNRPALLKYGWYSVVFFDLPIFAWGMYISAKGPPVILVNAVSGESGLVIMVAAMQLAFREREVLIGGVMGGICFALLLWRLGVGLQGIPWLIAFPAVVVLARYIPRRISALIEKALVEQRAVNQELRRQIADRAGQLASAIARLSAAPQVLEAGMTVEDRYRVLRPIGKGGMGAVYEIERISDGKHLAMKVISGVADREALARFAKEAQIAAELDHPNVVSVLDVDVSKSGMLFLVMELVPGNSLAAEKSRWGDPSWARPILKQIAAALAAMHARGVVHRDLKPANVLLDRGAVKVVDFGIASLHSVDGDSTLTKGITQTGAFMGTPMYMAPELIKGAREAQPSADLWSFGVMAHELITGKLPFAEPPVLARLEGRAIELSILDDSLTSCLSVDAAKRPTAKELSTRF